MCFWCFAFFPLIFGSISVLLSFNQSPLTKNNLGHLCFQTHLNSPSLFLSLSRTHSRVSVWSDVSAVLCDVEFTWMMETDGDFTSDGKRRANVAHNQLSVLLCAYACTCRSSVSVLLILNSNASDFAVCVWCYLETASWPCQKYRRRRSWAASSEATRTWPRHTLICSIVFEVQH